MTLPGDYFQNSELASAVEGSRPAVPRKRSPHPQTPSARNDRDLLTFNMAGRMPCTLVHANGGANLHRLPAEVHALARALKRPVDYHRREIFRA